MTSDRTPESPWPSAHLADELIDGMLRDFPGHRPGTRPIHSFGVVAGGRFQGTGAAARVTTATPLTAPGGVPVTVRFSLGTGNAGAAHNRRMVLGMSARFHGDDGQGFDLLSTTLPVFYVATIDGFRELTAAAEPPVPPRRRPWWRDALDRLNLRSPLVDPDPGDAGVVALSARRPEACPALVAQLNGGVSESFATRSYHAAHAFRLTGPDGASCFVRFSWEPVDGVRTAETRAECFLLRELAERGRRGPVRFVLRATVADPGDDTSDPSRPWPRTRRRLVLGHLTLDEFGHDDGEGLAFDPHRLPCGIEADPGDEIFRVRGGVYAVSVRRRAAERARSEPLPAPRGGRAACG